jgi:hypothetical protein
MSLSMSICMLMQDRHEHETNMNTNTNTNMNTKGNANTKANRNKNLDLNMNLNPSKNMNTFERINFKKKSDIRLSAIESVQRNRLKDQYCISANIGIRDLHAECQLSGSVDKIFNFIIRLLIHHDLLLANLSSNVRIGNAS